MARVHLHDTGRQARMRRRPNSTTSARKNFILRGLIDAALDARVKSGRPAPARPRRHLARSMRTAGGTGTDSAKRVVVTTGQPAPVLRRAALFLSDSTGWAVDATPGGLATRPSGCGSPRLPREAWACVRRN